MREATPEEIKAYGCISNSQVCIQMDGQAIFTLPHNYRPENISPLRRFISGNEIKKVYPFPREIRPEGYERDLETGDLNILWRRERPDIITQDQEPRAKP